MYYNECPLCGANLDPGEPCDCQEEKKSKKKLQLKNQSEHRNRAYDAGRECPTNASELSLQHSRIYG